MAAIFCSCFLNGRAPRIFEDGRQSRDFIHVRDIARANALALESPAASGHSINIGTGRPTSVGQVANMLLERLHPERKDDPALQPVIEGKFRAGDIRHCYGDVSLARELMGFEASIAYDEQGLDELIEWVRSQTSVDMSDKAYKELKERKLV